MDGVEELRCIAPRAVEDDLQQMRTSASLISAAKSYVSSRMFVEEASDVVHLPER